jgi:hypothetical protein
MARKQPSARSLYRMAKDSLARAERAQAAAPSERTADQLEIARYRVEKHRRGASAERRAKGGRR